MIMTMCVVGTAAFAQRRDEHRTTAKQQEVLKSQLASVPGKEGTVLRVELPAGVVGDWHDHTGDDRRKASARLAFATLNACYVCRCH